jgi:hypothetical protein
MFRKWLVPLVLLGLTLACLPGCGDYSGPVNPSIKDAVPKNTPQPVQPGSGKIPGPKSGAPI